MAAPFNAPAVKLGRAVPMPAVATKNAALHYAQPDKGRNLWVKVLGS